MSFDNIENAFTLESIMLYAFYKSVIIGLIDLLLKYYDKDILKTCQTDFITLTITVIGFIPKTLSVDG